MFYLGLQAAAQQTEQPQEDLKASGKVAQSSK